jgi:AcrR family transcriptional regulator
MRRVSIVRLVRRAAIRETYNERLGRVSCVSVARQGGRAVPKIVDHEARRAELAEALWRVLARDGLEGVTMRSVAAEAGRTRGIIEHYFESKEDLLMSACRLARERALAQVVYHHEQLVGREALRTVMLEDMALHGSRREAAGIWFGLLSAAARNRAIAAELALFDSDVTVVLAEIMREMIDRGEAAADLDPEAEARSLLAFNIGINLSVMMQPDVFSDEAVEAEVEGFLARLTRPARTPPDAS